MGSGWNPITPANKLRTRSAATIWQPNEEQHINALHAYHQCTVSLSDAQHASVYQALGCGFESALEATPS